MPPLRGRPLKLYLLVAKESIGCLQAQNNVEGHEKVVYYLSRVLNSTETRYIPIEKLCLTLYCMYKIETLLDQISSICGLLNRLDEIHA